MIERKLTARKYRARLRPAPTWSGLARRSRRRIGAFNRFRLFIIIVK
jgi:hypothetical protein